MTSGGRYKPGLREKALTLGATSLTEQELLALVIGTGTNGVSVSVLAARLCEAFGSFAGLAAAGPHALCVLDGIGPAKAARLIAALELGRRLARLELLPRPHSLTSFDCVVAWAMPRLGHLDHEEMWVLALDAKNQLRAARRVGQGGVHGCALTARDILRPAIVDAASAVVLVHNHPSGDATPSDADIETTEIVAEACRLVGIELLDHVIVARGGATSLRDFDALALPDAAG